MARIRWEIDHRQDSNIHRDCVGWFPRAIKDITQGLKPHIEFSAVTARVNSCHDTSCVPDTYFRDLQRHVLRLHALLMHFSQLRERQSAFRVELRDIAELLLALSHQNVDRDRLEAIQIFPERGTE